jgi:hypothetical protein
MKTEVGRNWHQLIHFDKLSCRQVPFFGPQWTLLSREKHNLIDYWFRPTSVFFRRYL